jgi:hypothetical protein
MQSNKPLRWWRLPAHLHLIGSDAGLHFYGIVPNYAIAIALLTV